MDGVVFRGFFALFFCGLGLIPAIATASTPKAVDIPADVIQAFERRDIRGSDVSISALPLAPYISSKAVYYSLQDRQLTNPASVVKLFTAGLALERLGSSYQFKTGFHATSPPVDGVLQGPLYVKGGGDPLFLTTDLWSSLWALRSSGVKVIDGPVIVDRSEFHDSSEDVPLGDDEDFDDAPHRAYHAKPDGLLMNHGAMAVHLIVDQGRVVLKADGAPQSWAFVSEIQTIGGGCKAWKNGMDVDIKKSGDNVVVTFSGRYPRRCGASTLPIRIARQDWLFESWFKELWASMGGRLKGDIIEGVTPPGSEALYTHRSPVLSQVIRDINKWSSNVMARHLELTTSGSPGQFDIDMKDWLGTMGVQTQGWFFENGSGLARQTRVDAKGLTTFLANMWKRPDMPDYLASLPRAGYDGTLHRKLKSVDQFAYMKTGSLSGVRSAAGYVKAKSGQWYAMAIFVDSPKAYKAWPAIEYAVSDLYKNH